MAGPKFLEKFGDFSPKKNTDWYWNKLGIYLLLPQVPWSSSIPVLRDGWMTRWMDRWMTRQMDEMMLHITMSFNICNIYQDWTLCTSTTLVCMFFDSSKHNNTIFQGCTLYTSTTLVHTFLRRSSGNLTQQNQPWQLILSFPTYLSLFMIWISDFATYSRPLRHGTVTPWCFLVQNVQQLTSSRLWKHGSTL